MVTEGQRASNSVSRSLSTQDVDNDHDEYSDESDSAAMPSHDTNPATVTLPPATQHRRGHTRTQ
ncbi:hypothetical protein KIPB_014887, partial [Kipferlia bialata]|eukprot:g14887.t1